MFFIVSLALLFSLSAESSTSGKVQRYNYQQQSFLNSQCQTTHTCSLLKFEIETHDYTVSLPEGPSFGTSMTASFESDGPETITDYAIVQFVRGCRFSSTLKGQFIQYYSNNVRILFEELVPFRHPQWVIDSNDRDPAYASSSQGRFFNLKWNDQKGERTKKGQHFYGQLPPSHGEVYIQHLQGQAFVYEAEANNISLSYQTCLYPSKNVPDSATPTEIHFATPLHCFSWNYSKIYDHTLKKFVDLDHLHPYCLNSSIENSSPKDVK